MALADRTKTPQRPPVHGAPCSIGQVYRAAIDDEPELREINSVLYLEDKNRRQVWDEFKSAGLSVAYTAINKHRGKTCRCFTIDKDLWCMDCRFDLAHCICDAA
jgi:hypothetical protein